jgi:hypothetical protein|tara:strand:+ start:73 stop:255 length:183 start_codon:yes stop_codon:yes gene_type:complete
MEIKSAKYIAEGGKNSTIKLVLNIMPKDIEFMLVPIDPANRHYQAIQEWVKEGNKIEDAD